MSASDGADQMLRRAVESWHHNGDRIASSDTYMKWSVPGGYTVTGGTLGAPPVDFVIWLAAAVGSGILGNAAYDAMKHLIVKVRERKRRMAEQFVLPGSSLMIEEQPHIEVDSNWILRPWRHDDAAMVVAAFADPDIQRWNMHRMDSEAEGKQWIEDLLKAWEEGTDAAWAVARTDTDEAAGFIALRQIRLRHARAELSGWGIPSARGMSIGAKATRALSRWSFDVLGLHRLFLLHSTANPASCRVAVNGGFRPEGVLRSYLLHTDGWHDMHLHARLNSDIEDAPL